MPCFIVVVVVIVPCLMLNVSVSFLPLMTVDHWTVDYQFAGKLIATIPILLCKTSKLGAAWRMRRITDGSDDTPETA